jgi:hypothetical protein
MPWCLMNHRDNASSTVKKIEHGYFQITLRFLDFFYRIQKIKHKSEVSKLFYGNSV